MSTDPASSPPAASPSHTPGAEFDAYAQEYEALLRSPIRDRFGPDSTHYAQRKLEVLLDYLRESGRDSAGLDWLDVGCGQGTLLRLGRDRFRAVAGCDISPAMLAGCGDLPVRPQATPTTLPHDDASFDLVTAVCVFHHVPVPDRPALAGELARILRPGGIAAIVEHNPLNPVTQLVVWQTPVDVDAVLLGARASRRLLAGAALVPQATRYLLYFPAGIHRRAPGLERALRHLPGGGQYAVFARRRS